VYSSSSLPKYCRKRLQIIILFQDEELEKKVKLKESQYHMTLIRFQSAVAGGEGFASPLSLGVARTSAYCKVISRTSSKFKLCLRFVN
jgi:hypothetical protein